MKTLESFFSRTAQFGLLIYLTGCFGLLIVLGAAVAKWLKLIDVIQYIAFAFWTWTPHFAYRHGGSLTPRH